MDSFQLSGGESGDFNEKVALNELRSVDTKSLVCLYVAKALLFLGIALVFLNNLNVIAPGSYFGEFNWVTFIVFSIGLLINFIFIPLLYFSSLKNFKKEIYFWDKETFWILPLFFFGTFFLYSAEISPAIALLNISVIIITVIHIKFIFEARKIFIENLYDKYVGREQYFTTLKYLTAYYVLLLILLFIYNPLQHAFFWIRMHV